MLTLIPLKTVIHHAIPSVINPTYIVRVTEGYFEGTSPSAPEIYRIAAHHYVDIVMTDGSQLRSAETLEEFTQRLKDSLLE